MSVRATASFGIITTYAGTGTAGYTGDGGAATAAEVHNPHGGDVDAAGDLFFADTDNNVVRKVAAGTGIITTVAGDGTLGYSGDGGPAVAAELNGPRDVKVDVSGRLYIVDSENQRIRIVDTAGSITTVIGVETTTPQLSLPFGVAQNVNAQGNGTVYAVDTGHNRIVARSLASGVPSGDATVVAGTGDAGFSGDGGPPTSALLRTPTAMAIYILPPGYTSGDGNLFIADTGNGRVRQFGGVDGTIKTIAGGGASDPGDGGLATAAKLMSPTGLAIVTPPYGAPRVLVADYGSGRIRVLVGELGNNNAQTTTFFITTIAGDGGVGFAGDGGRATLARFDSPQGVAAAPSGDFYVSDTNNERIRHVFPPDHPGGPTGLSGMPGDRSVSLSWSAPAADGGSPLIGYEIASNAGSCGEFSSYRYGGPPPTTATITGLYNGNSYSFQIAAMNWYYCGPQVSNNVTLTPSAPPTAPEGAIAQGLTGGVASIAWVPSWSGGGTSITGYTVTASPGGATTTVGPTATTAALGGLQDGSQYTFTVSASSGGGTTQSAATPSVGTGAPSPVGVTTDAGYPGWGASATVAQYPLGLAVDKRGVYIADPANNVVRYLDEATGVETILAGNDSAGYSGDGGPATKAMLNGPVAAAVDYSGSVYISDNGNSRVRKVSPDGTITTVAGNGTAGYAGDGGSAVGAELNSPYGLLVDAGGVLFIADAGNGAVREVSPAGLISTIGRFSFPTSLTDGGPNAIYVSDTGNSRIYETYQANGNWYTGAVAGTGVAGYNGDNIPAGQAQLNHPRGIFYNNASGTLYVADRDNNRVRSFHTSGGFSDSITTFAGTGTAGFGGDGSPATNAQLWSPRDVLQNGAETLIADASNFRVRVVSAGTINTVAGNGQAAWAGDGGQARQAQFSFPYAIAVDATGNRYVADTFNDLIRKITPAGVVSTVAGNGRYGFGGDGGPATSASLGDPRGVAVDQFGALYISDTDNNRVRKVDPGGTITTVAGNGMAGYSGDAGPATAAELNLPRGVTVDSGGALYIADTFNNRVRRVVSGTIVTVAGNGSAGFSGDGGSATTAMLNGPRGLGLGPDGSLYVGDSVNGAVRRITGGTITTITRGLGFPFGIAVDANSNVFAADSISNRVWMINPLGARVAVVAGCQSSAGFAGDGGRSSQAQLNSPYGVALTGPGQLLIADTANSRIRTSQWQAAGREDTCPSPPTPAAVSRIVTGSIDAIPQRSGSTVEDPQLPRVSPGVPTARATAMAPIVNSASGPFSLQATVPFTPNARLASGERTAQLSSPVAPAAARTSYQSITPRLPVSRSDPPPWAWLPVAAPLPIGLLALAFRRRTNRMRTAKRAS